MFSLSLSLSLLAQYVIVEAADGVQFDGRLDSLMARWTVAELEESAEITFAGPGAELLSGIRDITKASQLSNMAAYAPTDCPTREKHAWLGDGQAVAEEAMYNLFAPGLYEQFLADIREAQDANASSPWAGFVPGVVPGTVGHKGNFHDDISWTAAYPLIAQWLHLYYGDVAVVAEHWGSLKAYVDAQKRQMEPADGLPCFWVYGDWCSPVVPRHNASVASGPPAAAANYILAVEAMVAMAAALGEPAAADGIRYAAELEQWRGAFEQRFWNASTGTYTPDSFEVQTVTSIALGAGAVPAGDRRASAVAALDASVRARGHHLTVGSVGQKWLFRSLTAAGKHDTALAVGLQTSYPSFGHWLREGATTCWENWSGRDDFSHPGTAAQPNPPTHNHIFLVSRPVHQL